MAAEKKAHKRLKQIFKQVAKLKAERIKTKALNEEIKAKDIQIASLTSRMTKLQEENKQKDKLLADQQEALSA